MIKKRLEVSLHSVFYILFFLLIIIAILAGFTWYHTEAAFSQPPPFEIYPEKKKPPKVSKTSEVLNPYTREELCIPYTEPCIPYHKPIPDKKKPAILPKVAIIIDDIGYDRKIAEKLLSLNVAITFSVLPQSPFGKVIIKKAREKGIEIMLHLPMEPLEYPSEKPEPGAIYTDMMPESLISQVNQNLDALPFVAGVNNHMGSRITSNSSQMYQIFSVLKKRNLFFIDSFTNTDSLCRTTARLLNIRFAARDVFLDHVQEADSVRKQIKRLIHVAKVYGEAVGIGHPHTVTYKALLEMLPELKKEVQLVPASQLVHTVG